MADKHVNSKETDITGALVISFFVMLGILFVTLTGNLTKKSTSTSTKAAWPASCDTNNKQLWYGSSIECAMEKVNGKCPSTHVVIDNTFYIGSRLKCRSASSMNSFFAGDPTFVGTGEGSYMVRRSNSYCTTMTGVAGAKCLSSSYDYDLNSKQFRNADFRSLKKSKTKCPNYVQTGIMAPYAYFLSEDYCYTP
jgi:hypothetical protein